MIGKRLNIPSYIEDPNYRYQMPAAQLKIEGKGNGIKTNIVNMIEIAKALRVPTEYPLKFLGHELGSQTIFKEKGNDVTTIINGSFTEDEIKKSMDKFIEKYLLCPKCKYPELVLRVKSKVVGGKCNACGGRFDVDNVHKFAAYIVKNPPKDKSEITKKGGAVLEVEEKKKSSKKGDDDAEEIKDDLPDAPLNTLGDKIEAVQKLYTSFQVDSFAGKEAEVKEIIDLVNSFQLRAYLRSYILFQAIFDINLAKQIGKNKEILLAGQKAFDLADEELDLLLNLEYALYETYKSQSFDKYVPTILHTLYDQDLLSEKFLIEWDGNSFLMHMKADARFNLENDKKFREAAKDMINWLKTATEE